MENFRISVDIIAIAKLNRRMKPACLKHYYIFYNLQYFKYKETLNSVY